MLIAKFLTKYFSFPSANLEVVKLDRIKLIIFGIKIILKIKSTVTQYMLKNVV